LALNKHSNKILKKLVEAYPDARSELNFANEYELVCSVLLSAQCTDKKVNQITPILFKKYDSFQNLAKATLKDVEFIIRPINYYKTKSKHLIQMAEQVVKLHACVLPKTIEQLITLPGVGRKTASVVVGELGFSYSLPVDTHVFRVSKRLGFSEGASTRVVEEDLRKVFKKKDWHKVHHLLIFHGRRVCYARSPNCSECTVLKFCEHGQDGV
jgi:endonuclease III